MVGQIEAHHCVAMFWKFCLLNCVFHGITYTCYTAYICPLFPVCKMNNKMIRKSIELWQFDLSNHKSDVWFVFTSSYLWERSCLIYDICVYLHIVVSNTYCIAFCFVCLRLVYLMLSVSLDCPFLIAPSIFSNVYLI